jgi:ABC-type polar amino acid transport system ATPase subunit
MLLATQISKSFGASEALRDVSVQVGPGKLTVVLGPSGSGKTTLLRCISLLDVPQSGRVEIDGQAFSAATPGQVPEGLYPDMGVVFQNLALWPHLTLRENILLPLKLTRRTDADHPYVRQLIDTFGMNGFVDRLPHQVSGGEKQRAAIVRAMALRPKYLLLDEITSALDVEQVVVLLGELERLKREGVGILLITHLLGFAHRAADSFIFLDHGRVVEQGMVAQLKAPQTSRLQTFLRYLVQAS